MPLFSQIMAFTLQTYTIFGKFHLIKTTHINLITVSYTHLTLPTILLV